MHKNFSATKIEVEETLEMLKYEDLNEDLQMIADTIGLANTAKLLYSFGGSNIYFPQLKSIHPFVEKVFVKSGKSIQKTSSMLGVTRQHLSILARKGRWGLSKATTIEHLKSKR